MFILQTRNLSYFQTFWLISAQPKMGDGI